MLRYCLGAIAGAACCSMLASLPPRHWMAVFVAVAGLSALSRSGRLLAAALLGFLLFWCSAATVLDQKLAGNLNGKDFRFTAEIIDFPSINSKVIRFLVAPEDPALPSRVRLAWYRSTSRPALGEQWEFHARLRRPRGSRNAGGFDYEGWLHRLRIGASGYVMDARRIDGRPRGAITTLRTRLAARIAGLLPAGDARAALVAVTIGARHEVTAAAWERYAVTGTSHLMAISGLHIGLAAAGAAAIAWALGAVIRPHGNLRDRALLVALPAMALYTAMSGFALPSQRALLMTLCGTAAVLLRRPSKPGRVLVVIAAMILLADPLSILSPGFLLSFGAVAVLLQTAIQRRAPAPGSGVMAATAAWLQNLGVLQASLLLGLLPLTSLLFSRASWLSPMANLLVLPLFSTVTVPAALLGLLLDGPLAAVGDALLWLAWYSLQAIHRVIGLLAAVPGGRTDLATLQGASRLLLLLPCAWVLLPSGFPGRYIAWLGFAAVLLYRPPAAPRGCVDIHVLDVGQGLAVAVRTRHHTLLYDTGPKYAGGGSSADYAILPFLASAGVRRLDRVIVSHADQDHAGGVAALVDAIPIGRMLVGEPLDSGFRQVPCRAGQRWNWDDVEFSVLHPPAATRLSGNDASCVLQIRAGPARVLLTGDIEARVERQLLAAGLLPSVALATVPHHGSRTSSSADFVRVLDADTAIVSAAFQNRWGFPKREVVARWEEAGTLTMNTADSGAILHRVCADSGVELRSEHREDGRRYWHED